jgi:hypothetical protein
MGLSLLIQGGESTVAVGGQVVVSITCYSQLPHPQVAQLAFPSRLVQEPSLSKLGVVEMTLMRGIDLLEG